LYIANVCSTFAARLRPRIHDVAIQNLPVIFLFDRAELVGEDGATHHGIYDIAHLRCTSNLITI
jgi:1-deoxy-D-xylulose-5-phosphate synthase